MTLGARAQQPPPPDPQMKAVLDQLAALHPKPIESLTPQEARKQPSAADAVKLLLAKQGKLAPEPVGREKNITVKFPDHGLKGRVYIPAGSGPFPVVLYFHGGGWVIADLRTYDASARAICNAAKAVVVAVQYRQAPEYRFPAAHADALGAYQWVLQNAGRYGGDAKRVAVVGESAGGNLAGAVCLMAKVEGLPLPVRQVLIYPVADTAMNTPSYRENAQAKPLNAAMMRWFFSYYLAKPEDYRNPLVALVKAADLRGLPPATIITAQIDPLRSEGEAYAQRLRAAGVRVDLKEYPGVTHEFFGMGMLVAKAKDAEQTVGADLRASFGER